MDWREWNLRVLEAYEKEKRRKETERVHTGRIVWNEKVYDIYSPETLPVYTYGWEKDSPMGESRANGGILMKSKLRRLECKKIIKGHELGDVCGIFDEEGDIPVLYYKSPIISRKAFLEEPVMINGKSYIIELKCVGDRGGKINPNKLRTLSRDCLLWPGPPIGDTALLEVSRWRKG
jgi:hypothetical protein